MDKILKKLPRVKRCCCCISLDTGALTIGYLTLLLNIIIFIVSCSNIGHLIASEPEDAEEQLETRSSIGIYVYDIIVQTIWFIMSLGLVIGVHKKSPKYVFVWIYSSVFLIALKIVSAILFIFFTFGGMFVLNILYICFDFYLLVVVNTVYQRYENGGPFDY